LIHQVGVQDGNNDSYYKAKWLFLQKDNNLILRTRGKYWFFYELQLKAPIEIGLVESGVP